MWAIKSKVFIWEFPKIRGTLLRGPHNKDYSILGSILGSPYFGKLPYINSVPYKPLQAQPRPIVRAQEKFRGPCLGPMLNTSNLGCSFQDLCVSLPIRGIGKVQAAMLTLAVV